MGTWVESVLTMANFYLANVHTYLGSVSKPRIGRKSYACSLIGSVVYDDCSGFTSACLLLFGAFPKSFAPTSGSFATTGGLVGVNLRKAGFSPISFNINNLLPFDIVAKNGHVEIYAGKSGNSMRSYSWGNIHDGLNGRVGMPAYYCKDPYVIIWRNNGVSIDTPLVFNDNTMLQLMSMGYGTGGTFSGLLSHSYNNTASNYPTHNEYDTFSGTGGSVFSLAEDNVISFAYFNNPSTNTISNKHTRIYSTNDSSIVLDSLEMPIDQVMSNVDSSTNA